MRFLRDVLVGLVLILAASPGVKAQQPGIVSQRKAVPLDSVAREAKTSQLLDLTALQRKSPAAYDSLRAIMALTTQMQLAKLGYASGPFDPELTPDLVSAIQEYERDRGLAVTGDPLSYELRASLQADDERFEEELFLPSRQIVGDDSYVSVRGVWTFPDMGDQLIVMEVTCDRAILRCFESQAILRRGGFGPSLSTDQQQWVIARWDQIEIATEPVDFLCARYVLRINLVQKTATKVRSTISTSANCRHQGPDDLIITLSDGDEVTGARIRNRNSEPFPARLTPRASALLNRGVQPALPRQ